MPLFVSIGTLAVIFDRFYTPSFKPSPSVAKPTVVVAVTCQNISCINRDAVDNHCHQDVQSITSNVGNFQKSKNYLKAYKVELRYSKACQSTWARDESPAKSVHYVEDDLGKRYGTSIVPIDGNPNHYSDMGPGQGAKVRACAQPPREKVTCTSFVQL